MGSSGGGGAMKKKTANLRIESSDGEVFEVEECMVALSKTIANFVELDGGRTTESVRVLSRVKGRIFRKAMEYCRAHHHGAAAEMEEFDRRFVESVAEEADVRDLLRAGFCLDIRDLCTLMEEKQMEILKGKTPDQLLRHFLNTDRMSPDQIQAARDFFVNAHPQF